MKRGIIFLIGVAVWGFFHERIQARFENQWLFFALAVGYLVFLRLFSEVFGAETKQDQDAIEDKKE